MGLGLHHLENGNISDAVVRFYLVSKFFNPQNKLSLYYLGWCNFLKNQFEKSLSYLGEAQDEDRVNLKAFVEKISETKEVPPLIWEELRNFTATKYADNFYHNSVHLPMTFANEIMSNIKNLPDEYEVLEIGSNIGLAGYEVRKRFPEGLSLIGVEPSSNMIDLVEEYYGGDVYDETINQSIPDFLSNHDRKYDLIYSFCGLGFTSDFNQSFSLINAKLKDSGHFMICALVSNRTGFLSDRKEFAVNINEIQKALESNYFKIVFNKEISLGINNKYAIFGCSK
jgi:predicted TPR repeat methyltransferase